MATHVFDSDSGDVYDQTQYRDDIHSGDVLVVESEKVVGILVSAWPTAVTAEHGKLHSANLVTYTLDELCKLWTAEDAEKSWLTVKPDYTASLAEARRIADERGWPRH